MKELQRGNNALIPDIHCIVCCVVLCCVRQVIELLERGQTAGLYAQSLRDLLRKMSRGDNNMNLKVQTGERHKEKAALIVIIIFNSRNGRLSVFSLSRCSRWRRSSSWVTPSWRTRRRGGDTTSSRLTSSRREERAEVGAAPATNFLLRRSHSDRHGQPRPLSRSRGGTADPPSPPLNR